MALLAVLIGLGGGVVLTAVAGARRTSEAVPQMLAYSRPDDGDVVFGGYCPPPSVSGRAARSLAPLPAAARMLRLPQVAAFAREPFVFLAAGRSRPGLVSLNVNAFADTAGFRAIDRPLVVAGQIPGPGRPFDAAVDEIAAQQLHLGVGSRLTLYGYTQKQVQTCAMSGAALARKRAGQQTGPRLAATAASIDRTTVKSTAAGLRYRMHPFPTSRPASRSR
jgi:hypothetical protein